MNIKSIGADVKAYGQTGGGAPTAVAEVFAASGPCRLYSVTGTNAGAADYSIMVFDSATAPADGLAPLFTLVVAQDGTGAFDWQDGIPMANGCYLCFSSTKTSKTLPGGPIGFLVATLRMTS